MSARPPSLPDFQPLLRAAMGELAEARPAARRQPRRERFVSPLPDNWPELERATDAFAAVWQVRKDALGSFKRIGQAQIEADGSIRTTTKAWEFQGWLPFASRRVLPLQGAMAELELDVFAGEIGVAVLAEDGSQFVGERYLAGVGRHQIQLLIRSNEVKGIVFCSGADLTAPAHFRIRRAAVSKIDPTSAAAGRLRDALAATAAPPPESARLRETPATVPLVVFHLLGQGRLHTVRALLQASRELTGSVPAWFPARLHELLARFDGVVVDESGQATSAEVPAAGENELTPNPLDRAEREVFALRRSLTGARVVPLHLELLEFGHALDLVGTVQGKAVRFTWRRTALAATPVPRGLLRALLAVISERLQGDLDHLRVEATSTPAGTELWLHSGLSHGDLQYRDFSDHAASLHDLLNDRVCPPPRIEHRLGEENQLGFVWPAELPPAPDLPDLVWQTPGHAESGALPFYTGREGGSIRCRDGRCFKFAPPHTSKPNDLVQEAALLAHVADCDFVPQVLSAHRWREGSALSYPFENGETLAALVLKRGEPVPRTDVIRQLSDAVSELNQRGVLHRDLRAENILCRDNGTLAVLDFDQARLDEHADDFSNEWDDDEVCSGFGGLLRQLGWERDFLASAGQLAFAWELGRHSAANSPGKHACYYAWQWGPLRLEGERPWTLRWRLLQRAFATGSPGRFLELGCNLGLLSTYAALSGWQTHACDHDEVAVAAARQIAQTVGAAATFRTGDLTSPALFEELDETYDLVSALSVVHWLPDPGPVETFLRRQPRLLFEGHRAIADEEAYLHELGFDSVSLLGYSERLRPVLLASRTP